MMYSPKVLLAVLIVAAVLAALGLRQTTPEAATVSGAAPAPQADKPAASVPEQAPLPTPPQAADETLFADLGGLAKGQFVSLPLPEGGKKDGRLNYVNRYPNDARAAGGVLADGSGTFEIAREPWGYRGFILQ